MGGNTCDYDDFIFYLFEGFVAERDGCHCEDVFGFGFDFWPFACFFFFFLDVLKDMD